MLAKKFWIPIVCVLIGVAIGGTFWGKHVASQDPVKTYKPVERSHPATPKPPPPGETAESGHWHGDEWHAEPHEPALEGVDVPVEDYRDVELEAYEASLSHFTAEERATYDRALTGEITRHHEKYPDCKDYETVWEDADRHAKWWVGYKKWSAEWDESLEEKERARSEYRDRFDKLFGSRPVEEHVPFFNSLSDSERKAIHLELQALMEKIDAAGERFDEVDERKPTEPMPRHTH